MLAAGVFGLVYFAAAQALGVPEARAFVDSFLRRVRPRGK
jgi:hypothetical protein